MSESEKLQSELEPLELVKTHIKPEVRITSVETRRWAPGDTYEVVELQVFRIPARTPVRVTITPITQAEYHAYLNDETDAEGNKKS